MTKNRCRRKTLTKDRLSSLPDDLLTHILSFLTSKQSVSTSVLSTRWKYLFSSVPSLHFDSYEQNYFCENRKKFVKFVNHVLRLHNVLRIRSFRLTTSRIHVSYLTSWICAAIRLRTQLLEVTARHNGGFFLPTCVLNCQTLVHLKLFGNIVFSITGPVCLPSLKTCELNNCKFSGDDSARMLFSSCPVLEDLTLNDCYTNGVKVFSISVPSLKRLTILHSSRCEPWPCEWELNVLNLEYINCQSASARGRWYSVNNLKSLHKAEIHLGSSYARARVGDDDRIRELVNKFEEVQFLSLSAHSIVASTLACPSPLMPTLNKLTTLELKVWDPEGWKFFTTLLEKSPCLELLLIEQEGFTIKMFPKINVFPPKHIPLCFSQSLKEVKLRKYGGGKVQYKWLRYLLKNAKVLEKLTINVPLRFPGESTEECSTYLERQDEIKKKILALPRGSKACKIIIFWNKIEWHAKLA